MLFFSYKHSAGSTAPLVANDLDNLPTSETEGYSHFDLQTLEYEATDVADVRFYCETDAHSRIVNFQTSNSLIKTIATTANQSGNTPATWTTGFTPLAGHTGVLPGSTTNVFATATGGFHEFPFWISSANHWGVGALDRWECDDFSANSATTNHLIWARMNV